jgi:DNA-3-methyladenine glycosylase I
MASQTDRRKLGVQRHADGKLRCAWCTTDPLYLAYHDSEWGRPLHDDRKLFEMLCLEGAQAGLSWLTILRKRENYAKAFDGFDAEKMVRYGAAKRRRLLQDPGIVRNRLKVDAFIANAKAYLAIRDAGGSFDDYLWQFDGAQRCHEQGSEAPRLHFRRIDDLLRLHAGRGNRR